MVETLMWGYSRCYKCGQVGKRNTMNVYRDKEGMKVYHPECDPNIESSVYKILKNLKKYMKNLI
ncbi:MAG: hypothetical protein DRP15_02405 [Candidatus Aenigmatarchaeota archaeon]|nr:MAG: hypothetical protein DRP15_02405 [Candidatus Aenigmarchaeota archaeon]